MRAGSHRRSARRVPGRFKSGAAQAALLFCTSFFCFDSKSSGRRRRPRAAAGPVGQAQLAASAVCFAVRALSADDACARAGARARPRVRDMPSVWGAAARRRPRCAWARARSGHRGSSSRRAPSSRDAAVVARPHCAPGVSSSRSGRAPSLPPRPACLRAPLRSGPEAGGRGLRGAGQRASSVGSWWWWRRRCLPRRPTVSAAGSSSSSGGGGQDDDDDGPSTGDRASRAPARPTHGLAGGWRADVGSDRCDAVSRARAGDSVAAVGADVGPPATGQPVRGTCRRPRRPVTSARAVVVVVLTAAAAAAAAAGRRHGRASGQASSPPPPPRADGRRSLARAAQPAASCFGPTAERGSETGGPRGQRRRAAAARRRDAGRAVGTGDDSSVTRRRCATRRRPSVAGARARPRTPWSAAGGGTPNRGHISHARSGARPGPSASIIGRERAHSKADSTSSELCLSDGASGGTGPPPPPAGLGIKAKKRSAKKKSGLRRSTFKAPWHTPSGAPV